MKYLLDEQLDRVVSQSISPIAEKFEDEFVHILEIADAGTPDDEIPDLCRSAGIRCLVTANVRDFGSRKFYYQALLAEDLHVAVLRPGKGKFYEEEQLALLSKSYRRIRLVTKDRDPQLILCTSGGSPRVRSIADLIDEFDRGKKLP